MVNYQVVKRKVNFYSQGTLISAELYLPAELPASPISGVVLCHGFAGIKEILLPSYAEKFAENGIAALCFDYRGFGESEGERGRLVPVEQQQDIRAAITYLASLDEVNAEQISLWGSSFGGANAVAVAAQDSRVKALIVQLTFANGERVITGEMTVIEKEKLRQTINKAVVREVCKNKVLKLSPGQILTDKDSQEFYQNALKEFPQIDTKIPLSTLGHILEFKPELEVQQVTAPMLVIAAEHDIVCPTAESEYLFAAARPGHDKEYLLLKGARHYQVYEGEYLNKSAMAAINWMQSKVHSAKISLPELEKAIN